MPTNTALSALLYHIYVGTMDCPCALLNSFPVASSGKPTGADQKNLLSKYLCNCLCEKIVYAADFDFPHGIPLANLRLQNLSIYKKKINGIKYHPSEEVIFMIPPYFTGILI